MSYFRSHNCGELSVKDIDKKFCFRDGLTKKRPWWCSFHRFKRSLWNPQCVVNSDNEMFSVLET